ncbi:unnamed protein product, partial [Polarella glacialis]
GAALAFWSWWTAAPSSAEEPKALLMAGSGAGTAVALLRRASEASVAPRFPAVAELCSASSAERVLAAVGQGGVKTLLKVRSVADLSPGALSLCIFFAVDQLGPTSVAPLSLALPQASKSFEGPEQFRPSPALSSSFSGRRPARRLVVLVDDLSLPMQKDVAADAEALFSAFKGGPRASVVTPECSPPGTLVGRKNDVLSAVARVFAKLGSSSPAASSFSSPQVAAKRAAVA